MNMTTARRPLAILIAVIGLILLIGAIIWFAEPAKSLPGFMGHVSGETLHRTKHGIAALVAAVVCFLIAGFLITDRFAGGGRPAPRDDVGVDADVR